MAIDDTDRGLIAMLRDNARTPVVELARRLGVSRATVQNRLRRLERDGVIAGYTIRLSEQLERPAVRALMSVGTDSVREADVVKALRGHPNVVAVHHTTGRWDLIAEIHTDSLEAFNRIVGSLRLIKGVTATETNLLLESFD